MLGKMKRLLKSKMKKNSQTDDSVMFEKLNGMKVTKDIEENIKNLKAIMNNSFDFKERRFKVCGGNIQAAVLYIDNLVDESAILDHIIKPIMMGAVNVYESNRSRVNLKLIADSLSSIGGIETADTYDQIVLSILSGDTFLCVEGLSKGLLTSTRKYVGRTIDEAKTEPSVKGPKESFVENIKDNIGMLRKRMREPNLTFENFKVGRRARGDVVAVYLKGVVDMDIVDEVRKRVKAIDVDDGIAAGQVNHLLNDNPNSIFPLIQVTERPDKVISSLLEGRVAIILEGSPDVLVVPVTLPMLMQSVDDYYEVWLVGSSIRLLRYVSLFISALFPALYIALTSFHPGILPTNIVLSIAGTRQGVPFPAFIEAFLMTAILEVLQEAGIRLPRVVGQTVSIVGGLVIGQAAVQAGVISPVMVIVIAITAISSFVIPDYSLGLAARLLRIPFMIAATMFGTVGTSILLLVLLGYVCSLESYGVRYLEPITPYRLRDWKDTLIHGPQKLQTKRPEFLNPEDTQRHNPKKGAADGENN